MAIKLHEIEITAPTKAIICIGIPTESMQKFGVYFETVLDPQMLSPAGDMLRFEQPLQGGEVHGWQRVAELTVIELLGAPGDTYKTPPHEPTEGAKILLRAVKSWAA